MKMEAPEMGVVRFNESDVIVASSVPRPAPVPVPAVHTATVRGITNKVPYDGEVTFQGVTYKDSGALDAAFAEEGLSGVFQGYLSGRQMSSTFTTHDMFDNDADPEIGIYALVGNGVYTWNGSRFVHQ